MNIYTFAAFIRGYDTKIKHKGNIILPRQVKHSLISQ